MPDRDPARLMMPLSEEEIDELDDFLMSDAVSDETMMLDQLDGYLTAIIIGPTTVRMQDWLPGIWGQGREDAPEFETMEQAQRILDLITRHMNGIVWSFQDDPDGFEPMFDMVTFDNDPKEYLDAEMWAYGFMQGLALSREDWQPLFNDSKAAAALRPIHLLGAEEVSEAEDRLTRTPAQREKLAKQIPAGLAAIYRYWLTFRKAVHERMLATTFQREHPKVGRNDPCPCGSGKKFKKCCGAATVLH